MKIITTVGTSILFNWSEKKTDRYRDYRREFDQESWEDILEGSNYTILADVNKYANKVGLNASAEIASLVQIQKELGQKIEVCLICTYTLESRIAAECIKAFFDKRTDVQIYVKTIDLIQGLQVQNKQKFEKEGLPNLLEKIQSIAKKAGGWEHYLGLNITGGYKAIIPFLTFVGQIKHIPLYYIFEESEDSAYELLKMPQVPISLNWTDFFYYRQVLEDLDRGVEIDWKSFKNKESLPDDFLDFIYEYKENQDVIISLNAMGKFIYSELNEHFFVKFPIGCPLFKENMIKKKQILSAIQELYRRLETVTTPFNNLVDADIKHVPIEGNTHVYKQSNPQQMRIHYHWDETTKNLTVFNYRFKPDDPDYSNSFKKEYPLLKDQSTTLIGFPKL